MFAREFNMFMTPFPSNTLVERQESVELNPYPRASPGTSLSVEIFDELDGYFKQDLDMTVLAYTRGH
eukprot:scaffold656_cov403-Pavlova_lutheri.AAC.40